MLQAMWFQIYAYTPITLDKDRNTISKFGNIGPERSASLLDIHTTQCSQQRTGGDLYGRGQAWRGGQFLSMFKTYVTRSWNGKNAVNTHCEHCNNGLHAGTA